VTTLVLNSTYFTSRHVRNLLRRPWEVGITLLQPLIWLIFFNALFKRVVQIPGFPGNHYIDFLAPGIVIMTALFSGGFNGMKMLRDMHDGLLDRMLTTPASRTSLIIGPLAYQAVTTVIQGGIMLIVALAFGAHFPDGMAGVIILLVSAVLISVAFAGLSNALALLLRHEESLTVIVNFLVFPATFLSTTFMAGSVVAGWIAGVARFNPVNWAVQAGRGAMTAHPDWSVVFSQGGYLLAFTFVCGFLAVRAFRGYQRSI
jgi:ABC-2 type transport system permease protein